MKLTKKQIEHIRNNFPDEVDETIKTKIDTDLIYNSDIEDAVNRFSSIVECLQGNYTIENLHDDLYNDYYYGEFFEDVAVEVYDEYLDESQKKEIDELDG